MKGFHLLQKPQYRTANEIILNRGHFTFKVYIFIPNSQIHLKKNSAS